MFNIFRKKHLYTMQFSERGHSSVEAYSKYEAALLMWEQFTPQPTQCFPEGRGAFGSFDVFWNVARKQMVDWGRNQ